MKKIKVFSAAVLILSLIIGVFTACKKDEQTQETTTTAATTEAATTEYNGYSYPEVIFTEETQVRSTHTPPPVPTKKPKETKASSGASSESASTTVKNISNDKISEENNGLHILSKTTPVIKGNSASIIITGTPFAEYTIEFYETATKKAAYSGLGTEKSDSNGIATWVFTIESDCEAGNRKVIIREKNSDKYIQTSITVI